VLQKRLPPGDGFSGLRNKYCQDRICLYNVLTEKKMSPSTGAKERRLNFRASKEQHAVIERGATVQGQNLTQFVVSSAYEKAEQVLADQRNFVVSGSRWNAFVAALDKPVRRHDRLARLLSEPSILER
jgi:uncharacterized protein (DUF1778 family)